MKRMLTLSCCLFVLGPGVVRSQAISLAEGLVVISRSGREIAVSAAEEEVLKSGPILDCRQGARE